jgi:hypothetical protein
MAVSITSRPINSIPKPIKKGAILLRDSLLVVKIMMTPTKATAANTELMLKPPLLRPERANKKAVRVVPTFAPSIKPDPCFTDTILAWASPTVIMEVAEEDWAITVVPMPIP